MDHDPQAAQRCRRAAVVRTRRLDVIAEEVRSYAVRTAAPAHEIDDELPSVFRQDRTDLGM